MTPGKGCDYQGYEFGGGYLDSVCIDGYLWDADSCFEDPSILHVGGDIPCPKCNPAEYEQYFADDIEDISP